MQKIENNYFPSYECGECSANLALDYNSVSLEEVVTRCCCNCELYKKKIIRNDSYSWTYKGAVIKEVVDSKRSYPSFEVYGKLFQDIICACDYIDEVQNV